MFSGLAENLILEICWLRIPIQQRLTNSDVIACSSNCATAVGPKPISISQAFFKFILNLVIGTRSFYLRYDLRRLRISNIDFSIFSFEILLCKLVIDFCREFETIIHQVGKDLSETFFVKKIFPKIFFCRFLLLLHRRRRKWFMKIASWRINQFVCLKVKTCRKTSWKLQCWEEKLFNANY